MAHLTTTLPWQTLASTMHVSPAKHPPNRDLHLRFRPDQASKLTYFVEAVCRAVREHAANKREQIFPGGEIPVPGPEDVVLDERIVDKITPTVKRWRGHWDGSDLVEGLGKVADMGCKRGQCKCEGVDGQGGEGERWPGEPREEKVVCGCVVPMEFRRVKGFRRGWRLSHCYQFFLVHGRGFFALELVKTLLLYGEMETVLRLCGAHGEALRSWWEVRECQCEDDDRGWDRLCQTALLPYLTLNLIHCFPETWDAASGRTDATDYRDMRIYQYMVKQCTAGYSVSEVNTHPHRQFFGIADRQFCRRRHAEFPLLSMRNPKYPYGLVPYSKFLTFDNGTADRRPGTDDVAAVRLLLHRGPGLPMELVLEIMALAAYEPRGRLRVADDPFHRANRDELDKYINYCWQVLVRCQMMAAAVGMEIDWPRLVSEALIKLLTCAPSRRWFRVSPPWEDDYGTVTFV